MHEIGDGESRQRGIRKSKNNSTGTRYLLGQVRR